MLAASYIQSHLQNFYFYVLPDYLDYDAIVTYSGNNNYLVKIRDKLINFKQKQGLLQSSSLNKDQFFINESQSGLELFNNFLKALEIRQDIQKFSAIMGGKMPLPGNIVPGGVICQLDISDLSRMHSLIRKIADFISRVYLVDLFKLCLGPLLPLAQLGLGVSYQNFLSLGEFPLDSNQNKMLFYHGVIFDGKIAEVPGLNFENIEFYKEGKAPLYKQKVMETGSLARLLVMGENKLFKLIKDYNLKFGSVARYLARGLEAEILISKMEEWLEEIIENNRSGNFNIHIPIENEISGESIAELEAPTGSMIHLVYSKAKEVKKYEIYSPTNWIFSPVDSGRPTAIEKALLDIDLSGPEDLINIFRVIRSFEPCGNCHNA